MARTIGFSIDGDEPILADISFENANVGDWICNDKVPNNYGRIVKKNEDSIIVDINPLFNINSPPLNKDEFNYLGLKKIINAKNIIAGES